MEKLLSINSGLNAEEIRHLESIKDLIKNMKTLLDDAREIKCIKFTIYPEFWQNENRYTLEIASFVVEDYNEKPIDWLVNKKLRSLIAEKGLFHPLGKMDYESLKNGGEDNYLTHFDYYIDRVNIDSDDLFQKFIGKIFQNKIDRIILKEKLDSELNEKSGSSGRTKI